jgi:hypothetical protein
VAELMVEAAARMDYPTSGGEVVQWFAEHYPKVKASTIRAHIVGLTANDRSRITIRGMMVSRMAIARWLSSRCSAMGRGSGALCPPLGARLGLSKLR